jgi:exoribonuclease-2
MNILYEEDGAIRVAAVMTDNVTSLQVETPSGRRAKIKSANVLLRFDRPPVGGFMEAAEAEAAGLDVNFLWECCGPEEFLFTDLARDYYGREPGAVEAAAVALKLHGAPMYFYKKGKGRYKAAPEENLKAALASEERKRRQAETVAAYVRELTGFRLPGAFTPEVVEMLLYAPDKNTLEYRALDKACQESGFTPVGLLEKCGAVPSSHDYHLKRFLREHFPAGTGFPELGIPVAPGDPASSDAVAFSIDDAATTEIDDAFSVTRLPNGNRRIGIHIAAPGLGVQPGDALDELASRRLSTVYMPGRKITMLPDPVVDHFTLGENRRCRALSLYLEVTPDYQVVGQESAVDQVEIAANLRHDALEPFFNDETVLSGAGDYPYKEELLWLWQFATRLKEGRGKGEVKPAFPDYHFTVVGDRVIITERRRDTPIDRVVSELMIRVNSQWGRELAEAGIAAIYRTQENGKVRMSTVPAPHQGLGVTHYMWASSPLRRYVDLLNQRQLIARLEGRPAPYTARDERLLAGMRGFELAYEAYASIQETMERYWSLRWLVQEGVAVAPATVVKENLVKLDRVPLYHRPAGMPDLPPGSRVAVEVGGVDLLELIFSCKFKHKLEE